MSVFLLLLALGTSVIGSICGIGGGVIIKPVLDALNIMSVSAISFLSGCTVLAMAVVSVTRSVIGGRAKISLRTTPFLGLGAAFGGILGKMIFTAIKTAAGNENLVGLIQAIALTLVTVGTLIYMLLYNAGKVRTMRMTSPVISAVVGLVLGLLSSFLGIGGGPMNLAMLAFFFSMDAKEAATNSLCIILISQTVSLGQTFLTHSVPDIVPAYLIFMALGGVFGGLIGQAVNKRLDAKQVSVLFNLLMLLVIAVCIYNVVRFSAAV